MLNRLFLLLALLAAPAAAQPITPAELSQIDRLVTKSLADTQVPSASIAIVRGGRIVLVKAYGQANEGLPARPDLPYQVASNSKQFTAMALLLLEDGGRLDLDDTVGKWLPGISGGNTISLRQLLNHTSGLRDYWPQDYTLEAMSRPVAPRAIADRWAKIPLDFEPGSQAQYSNTAYVVAGLVAEKAAGEPLMDYLARRIFRPLEMTSVMSQDDALGARYPSGYGRHALGPVRPVTPAAPGWLWAAGELAMTAEDFAKWNIARIERSLIPAEDWEAQEAVATLTDGTRTNNGLGVFVRDSGGRRIVTHGGESVGFLSTNSVYPAERAAITVLTNSWSGDAYSRIARGLADIVLAPAPKDPSIAAAAAKARLVYDQLRSGTLDRSLLTENANHYFTGEALADYHSSLGPLGAPTAFEPDGKPSARGGFMIQSYKLEFPDRTLSLSTFYEPDNGRIEQFLVRPAQ